MSHITATGNTEVPAYLTLGELGHKVERRFQNSHSEISINQQWRIIFRWEDGLKQDVEITDYH